MGALDPRRSSKRTGTHFILRLRNSSLDNVSSAQALLARERGPDIKVDAWMHLDQRRPAKAAHIRDSHVLREYFFGSSAMSCSTPLRPRYRTTAARAKQRPFLGFGTFKIEDGFAENSGRYGCLATWRRARG